MSLSAEGKGEHGVEFISQIIEHCKIETTIDEIVKYQSEKLNSVEQIVILISAGNNSQII